MHLRRLIAAQSPRRLRPALSRSIATSLVAVAIAVTPLPSMSYGGLGTYQLSPEDVALLPEFCRHTQLIIERHGSTAAQREWVARVGPAFMHMHHYCIAVLAYVRSFRHSNTAVDRNGYLVFALQNLTYVVDRAEPKFAFLPEVLYRRGQVRFRQGNLAEANQDFEDALRGDPNHTRASYELSQVAIALGDRARAQTILQKALEKAPGSRLLESAIADLQKLKQRK